MDIIEAKAGLIEKIIAEYAKKHKTSNESLSFFARQLFQRAAFEYLHQLKINDLITYLELAWDRLQQKSEDVSEIKLTKIQLDSFQTPRYLISILNSDRPFIVDSLLSFLTREHIKPEFLVHPVLNLLRTSKGDLIDISGVKIKQDDSKNVTESFIFLQVKPSKDFDPDRFGFHLQDVMKKLYWVVDDWPEIKKNLSLIRHELSSFPAKKHMPDEVTEAKTFLSWLDNGHFIFLGARYFAVETQLNKAGQEVFCVKEETSFSRLGLLRDDDLGNADDLVPVFARAKLQMDNNAKITTYFPLITVMKTNQRSPVHRSSRIDTIEVMDLNEQGNAKGIYQFIGIFTKDSFAVPAFEVPILKRKAKSVFDRFGLDPKWHDGKSLIDILDSVPRDEMFYLSEEQLMDISQRVLHMKDTGNLVLFTRPDIYGCYVTVMIFMPRDRYSFELKDRLANLLQKALKGKITSSVAHMGDLPFARIVYIITYDKPQQSMIDSENLEQELTLASLSWYDYLERILSRSYSEEVVSSLISRYRGAFESTYREKFEPDVGEFDIRYLEQISENNPIDIYLYPSRDSSSLKLKIFFLNQSLTLSALLPILYNLGLKVAAETTYCVKALDRTVYIHDFEVDSEDVNGWSQNSDNLICAFKQIWTGDLEDDGVNQLILKASLSIRETCVIRAYSRFLQQAKLPFSQGYVESALITYPKITQLLIRLFDEKFDPSRTNRQTEEIILKIQEELQVVNRLDHDRILRRFVNAIQATVRTNFFQNSQDGHHKTYLSFKFDCAKLSKLPKPHPLFEIFVHSSRVDAVHLRGGKVARGGIRWSDRFEDFRTEILGLMKAQMVKNSVIVPTGSKGGFIVKRQEQLTNRADLIKEVEYCYQTMMRGLLDITDNLVDGNCVPPVNVVRYDEDDPYLVVAADKGTATFSDMANAISQEYGFWLGDAFASGGSAGYDHKKMAITSRGAWESVKRHFRELNQDVQKTPFTVVGVGDMAGDVFGNGMLRSTKIRLVAAFNHQHIFIDPDPDPETSFNERLRLFTLPRSTWMDYEPDVISKGGGVYLRSAKIITLTPEVQALFGIHDKEIAPDLLVQKILKLPVDLLWFGGIGTFVKASTESHADVGDVANNNVRVDAKDVQARVVGEGANLGVTQLARIEYALKRGGRINTDAIDNSAGVDCSDHEVNIKILFNLLKNKISRDDRDDILRRMTDDVARLVLQDNYRQTQILTVMESKGAGSLKEFSSIIKKLEHDVNLDRAIEFLPDEESLERRRLRNQGMARPELSVIMAYAKNALYEKLSSSDLIQDMFYYPYLKNYFPDILSQHFEWAINKHPLKREIIATVLANTLINRVGVTFVDDLVQASGRDEIDVVNSFFHAVDLLGLEDFWAEIESLDDRMICHIQLEAYEEITRVLHNVVLWLLHHRGAVVLNKANIRHLQRELSNMVEGDEQLTMARKILTYHDCGLSQEFAEKLAVLPYFSVVLDIANHAKEPEGLRAVAESYFALRSRFGIDWLSAQVSHLSVEDEWQRAAQLSLIDDLGMIQSFLMRQVIDAGYIASVQNWISQQENEMLKNVLSLLTMLKKNSRIDFGIISFSIGQIQRIVGLK